MEVSKWIRLLIDSFQTYFFDVFVELPFLEKEKLQIVRETPVIIEKDTSDAPYLLEMANEFEKCLTLKKKFCLTNNARIHYTKFSESDVEKIDNISKAYKKYLLEDKYDAVSKYDTIDKIKKEIQDSFLTKKLTKEFNKIPSSDIRNKLLNFIQKEINKLFPLIELTLKDTSDKRKKWDTLESIFLTMESYISDFYLLSRVFKSFDVGEGLAPRETQNVIIYVNEVSATRYRAFFKELKYNSFLTLYSGEDRCIKLPGSIDFESILVKWKR